MTIQEVSEQSTVLSLRRTRKCDKRQTVTIISTGSHGHRPRISFDAKRNSQRKSQESHTR